MHLVKEILKTGQSRIESQSIVRPQPTVLNPDDGARFRERVVAERGQ